MRLKTSLLIAGCLALLLWAAMAGAAGPARAEGIDRALALAKKGEEAQKAGEMEGAVRLYTQALTMPDLPPKLISGILLNRGLARKALMQYDEALADMDRSISLTPGNFLAYNARGNLRETAGQLDEAIADFNRAIEIEPEYSSAYYNRSLAYEKKGDLKGALADARKFAELAPDHPWGPKRIRELNTKLPPNK